MNVSIRILRSLAITISLVWLSITPSFAQTLDFKGVPFDSSPDEVTAKLGRPDNVQTAEQLKSKGGRMLGDLMFVYSNLDVAGYSASTEVEFENNMLLGGSYTIQPWHGQRPSDNQIVSTYVNAYHDLLDKLSKKYGQPQKSSALERIGENKTSSLFAEGIAQNAPYSATWSIAGGQVLLVLSYENKNDSWSIMALYLSPRLLTKIDAANKAQANNTEGL